MKRFMLLLAFLISVGTSVWGQEEPSSSSMTVDLSGTGSETAESLSSALGEYANNITHLTIKGPLTAEDFATLKSMSMLQVLDMGEVSDLPKESITIEGDTKERNIIPQATFENNYKLSKVVLPQCVEVLQYRAFGTCTSLGTIDFSKATELKEIGACAFSKCSSLSLVDLSNCTKLVTIYSEAFAACNNLKEINLSACTKLKTIGSTAFSSCSLLDKVDLTNCSALSSIGNGAFSSCKALSSFIVVGCTALSEINERAFWACEALNDFGFQSLSQLKSIGISAFASTGLNGTIVFGTGLQQIGNYAFENTGIEVVDFTACTALSSISMLSLRLPELKEIKINNQAYLSDDGILYNKEETELIYYPANKEGTEFRIPNTVAVIGSEAFYLMKHLKQITVPYSVTSIGERAFGDAYNRLSVIFENQTPIGLPHDIGLDEALVYVPKGSLESYQRTAVWQNYTLIETGAEGTSVVLETAGSLGAKLTDLGVTLNTIQELKVSGPMNSNDFEVIKQMTLLTKVDLSEASMAENKLPNDAFRYLSYLQNVILPDNLESIGNTAFHALTNLVSVNLPSQLKTIGSNAFQDCSNLSKMDLSSCHQLTVIEDNAFGRCGAIPEELVLPSSIQRLGYGAFYNTGITKVDFANTSIQYIDQAVFDQCHITGNLVLPASIECINNKAFATASFESIKLKSQKKVELGNAVFESTNKTTCTVYVPKGLGTTYKADTYWSPFGNNIVEYGYLVTVTVNDDSGYATGGGAYEEGETVTLTASLYEYRNGLFAGWFENNQKLSGESTYSFTMGDTDRSIEARFSKDGYGIEGWSETVTDQDKADGQTVTIWPYGSSLWVKGNLAWNLKELTYSREGSLLVESPVTAEQINVQASVSGNRWYFISFPYDLKLSEITLKRDCQFVVREYDGAVRATNGMGESWKQLGADATMEANKGYIIQFAQSSGLDSYNATSGMEALFNRQAVTIPLEKHASNVSADANWNLVGNPFPCYFSVEQLFTDGLDGTVTVWSDQLQNYEYYTQDDEGVYLAPLTAFFIQHSGSTSGVTFKPEGRVAALPTTRAALAELRSDMGREVINLQLANDSLSDKTRVVFNEAASTDYELGKDAAKFSSMNNNAPSLYSLDAQNQQLAINERPVGNGLVRLGCYIGVKGSYTLSAKEALASDLYLYDTETGASCNLRETSYTFTAEAGVCNNRFELRTSLKGTGVEVVEGFSWQVAGDQLQLNGLPEGATVSLFDVNGRMRFTGDATTAAAGIALPQSGIYYLIIRTAEGVSSTVSIKR